MRKHILIASALALICAGAWAQPFSYLGRIQTQITPHVVAADPSGGLYYSGDNVSSRGVYYIANPVAAINSGLAEGVLVKDYTSILVASRGIQGLEIDSAGNVYVTGDSGTAGASVIEKFGPAPTFTPDATFNTGAAGLPGRHTGCALVGDGTLAVAILNNGVDFISTTTGSAAGYTGLGAGTLGNYVRSIIYNPTDNLFYPLHNGTGTSSQILGYLSGGTPAAGGYSSWTASALVADGALTGTSSYLQQGFLDTRISPNRLYTCDSAANVADAARTVRVWTVGSGGTALTLAATITPTNPTTGADPTPNGFGDCVRINSRLYASASFAVSNNFIYVYGGTLPAELSVLESN